MEIGDYVKIIVDNEPDQPYEGAYGTIVGIRQEELGIDEEERPIIQTFYIVDVDENKGDGLRGSCVATKVELISKGESK